MVTWFKARCAGGGGGGNVTFGVYIYSSRPYSGVSAAFWATLKGVTLYVVMTVT